MTFNCFTHKVTLIKDNITNFSFLNVFNWDGNTEQSEKQKGSGVNTNLQLLNWNYHSNDVVITSLLLFIQL